MLCTSTLARVLHSERPRPLSWGAAADHFLYTVGINERSAYRGLSATRPATSRPERIALVRHESSLAHSPNETLLFVRSS